MTIKDALGLINTDKNNGMFARYQMVCPDEAQVVDERFEAYKAHPNPDNTLRLINAAMNWLAATGRAEGEIE